MSFSGTVSQTVINTQTVIDHAVRRCGKLAEEIASEQQIAARENLYFLLSHMMNRGIQYFAVNKIVIGLNANQYEYVLPSGANDALNVLYRQMAQPTGNYTSSAGGIVSNLYDNNVNTYCQQTNSNGNFVVNYGSTNPQYIGSIGIMPYIAGGGTATWSYYLQSSSDGATWNTMFTATNVTVTDGQWIWQDIDPGYNVIYYRIQAFNNTTLALREWYLGNNSREIEMSRLNRDDYTNLPNKNFTANQPFQYWFNRTIPNPTLVLWPVPSTSFVQMTVWYSAYIEDVGSLSQQLAIPQRWYEATIFMLAHRMSLELPQIDPTRIQYLEKMADKFLYDVEQEERDKSPEYFAPNISVYTR
jgi:hypothetical protein